MIKAVILAGMSVTTLAVGLLVVGVRYNHTPSMPRGVWIIRAAKHYRAGDIIEACPDLTVSQRVYLGSGVCPTGLEPVLKQIAAVAGDVVSVTPAGLTVNGVPIVNSAPLTTDHAGRPLTPYPDGTYQVPDGYVWLIGAHPDSFDSRYFGPMSNGNILALAHPIWTLP